MNWRKVKFLCLANSYKEGGRCLAGVELDQNNFPIFENGVPKWIRPVYRHNEHGQVPTEICQHISKLDIVEMYISSPITQGYQSENVEFDEKRLDIISKHDRRILECIHEDKDDCIFSNKGKSIHKDHIGHLKRSLMMLKLCEYEIVKKENKTRLIFKYKTDEYDLAITDPNLKLVNSREIFITLSIAISYGSSWYTKLVAALM